MKATYWGPGTAAQYAAGSAGLHWPHQEKLPLAPLFFFSFVNVLTVSEVDKFVTSVSQQVNRKE